MHVAARKQVRVVPAKLVWQVANTRTAHSNCPCWPLAANSTTEPKGRPGARVLFNGPRGASRGPNPRQKHAISAHPGALLPGLVDLWQPDRSRATLSA